MKKVLWLLLVFIMATVFTSCGSKGDALYEEGVQAYTDGDYELSMEKMKEALEQGVSDQIDKSDLYAFIGGASLETGDIAQAIDYYTKALEEDDSNVRNYVNLAISYRQDGDLNKAKELYLQASEIDPDYAELNSSLGSLFIIEGDPTAAIEYFNKAIKADPNLAVAWGNCALAYAMTGDFEKADAYLNTSMQKGYENAETMKQLIEEEKNR